MDGCKPVETPEVTNDVLNTYGVLEDKDRQEQMKGKPYRELVGALLYAAILTRIDIAHAVYQLSKHNNAPMEAHWNAGKRVLRYLKGTSSLKLKFGGENTFNSENAICVVLAFCDADHANDKQDRKSVTGVIVKLNGDVVSWSSKKQSVVAGSTCEAEYLAMYKAVQHILFLRNELQDMGLNVENNSKVYCDNKAATILAKTDVLHDRSKHIDTKYHMIRDNVNKNIINVEWISTEEQQADLLTKALPVGIFRKLREKLLHA